MYLPFKGKRKRAACQSRSRRSPSRCRCRRCRRRYHHCCQSQTQKFNALQLSSDAEK